MKNHEKKLHGFCPDCGHYGDDCTGSPEHEETKRGELIAEVLKLKKKDGRYLTTWGTKTALGLFRTVERLVKDGK